MVAVWNLHHVPFNLPASMATKKFRNQSDRPIGGFGRLLGYLTNTWYILIGKIMLPVGTLQTKNVACYICVYICICVYCDWHAVGDAIATLHGGAAWSVRVLILRTQHGTQVPVIFLNVRDIHTSIIHNTYFRSTKPCLCIAKMYELEGWKLRTPLHRFSTS